VTEYGLCDHCATLKLLRPDGLVSMHYLRGNRTASTPRGRRKRCPGSRKPPRHPTEIRSHPMSEIVQLSVAALHPNAYNPNRMTDQEFAELAAEVRHLKRLPKPIVVRPDQDGYVIVDGEHGWRAASEAGLGEVACEVIDADDFEAMRQTYKRNQHGTHHPVLLGRLFKQMMRDRGLSGRALADEIGVSEGTIRNAAAYADAAEVRNGYAFEQLTIRQLRVYLSLPQPVGDVWLDAGARLDDLAQATLVTIDMADGRHEVDMDGRWQDLAGAGLAVALTKRGFLQSARRAWRLLWWRDEWADHIDRIDDYIAPVVQHGFTVDDLVYRLPRRVDGSQVTMPISPERWAEILADCAQRAQDADERKLMLAASVRMDLAKAGIHSIPGAWLRPGTDPRIVEAQATVDAAPDFIRDADLNLDDRLRLAELARPEQVPPDLWEEAQRNAVKMLEYRDRILTGREPAVEALDDMARIQLQVRSRQLSVVDVVNSKLQQVLHDRQIADRNDLLADPARLIAATLDHLHRLHAFRAGVIDGRPALEVLAERLGHLPEPELILLAAYALGGLAADAAPMFWLRSLGGEANPSAD
jgi:ParB/RepB/Spo0J family partition protein